MKFMKKKGIGDVTVRAVMDDWKSKVLCVVGTVRDLEKVGLLYPENNLEKDLWLTISNCDSINDHFGQSRDEALEPFVTAGF